MAVPCGVAVGDKPGAVSLAICAGDSGRGDRGVARGGAVTTAVRGGIDICRSGTLRSRCMTGGSCSGAGPSWRAGVATAGACCGLMPSSSAHRLTGSARLGVDVSGVASGVISEVTT